jgi:hypothetical protein
MNDAPERTGVPRWLAITGALATAAGAVAGIVFGVYPLVHHSSDHGESAYENLAFGTCSRVHDVENRITALPQPVRYDEQRDAWVYDKKAIEQNLSNGYAAVSSELDTLQNHEPPAPLADKYRQFTSVYADWKKQYLLTMSQLQSPSVASPMSEADVNAVLEQSRDAANHVRSELGDALSGLAAKPCTV